MAQNHLTLSMFNCSVEYERDFCAILYISGSQPSFFQLRSQLQPLSINCTRHICKIFEINILAVISNVYVFDDYVPFSDILLLLLLPFFLGVPLMSWFVPLGVRVPQIGNHCCIWTSLCITRLPSHTSRCGTLYQALWYTAMQARFRNIGVTT